jgi:PAS domain S-box-containing protein
MSGCKDARNTEAAHLGVNTALLAEARPLLNSAGDTIGSVAAIRTVTDEKFSQEKHRNLTAERDSLLSRLELQIERMPLAYVLLDADFRILDWNSSAERIFGYTRDEVLGMGPPFERILPPHERPKLAETLGRILLGDMTAHSDHENLTEDGRTITCEWFNTPLIDDDGRFDGMFCLVQDVTERKALEEQFRQSQKMEAIGLLAGGVAHDFNNLLTIIIGYSDMMLRTLQPMDANLEALEEIRKAGERAASLTRQLLAFSKKQVFAPIVLNLNEVVADTEKMLRRVIGEDIELSTAMCSTLGHAKVDPGQLEQVLLNLAVNARDAMPKGGRLTIETNNVEWRDGDCNFPAGVRIGQYIMLSVNDTGVGMTDEVKRHLFEPFFTTKGTGKGTGLGLAVVHGIVRQSDGHIEVESEPACGATFNIYLPRVNQATSTAATIHDPISARCGSEHILLVEDDNAVRAMSRQVLQECGYTVLEAGCGDEALEVCAAHAGPLDLLVTDVVMPGMGGRELAERLIAIRPELTTIFVSGYMDDAVVRHGIIKDEVVFLGKPYTPLALTKKVREVLDGPKRKSNR